MELEKQPVTPQVKEDDAASRELDLMTPREGGDTRPVTSAPELNLAVIAADKPSERAGTATATRTPYDWRAGLTEITDNLQKLEKLGANDPQRAAMIAEIDRKFQQSIPEMSKDATNADARLIVGVVQAQKAEQRMQDLMKDTEVVQALSRLNVKPESATGDDVQNAILNATTDSARKKLTEVLTVGSMQALSAARADDAYWAQRAPMLATLEYAQFLNQYKNGVSVAPDGKVFSSTDVLDSLRSAEVQATTETMQVKQASDAAALARQAEVVPAERNPRAALEKAMRSTDPAERMLNAQFAVQLAQDKQFDPAEVRKKIVELKSNGDMSPLNQAKIAAWQDMEHVRGMAHTWLAYEMMQQPRPDYKGILEQVAKAKEDPEATKLLKSESGQPLFEQIERVAQAGQTGNVFNEAGTRYVKSMQEYTQYAEAMQKAAEGGNEPLAKHHLNKAYDSLVRAAGEARELSAALGPDRQKIEDEFKKLNGKPEGQRTAEEKERIKALTPFVDALHFESQALTQLAQLDMMKGNPDLALVRLNRVSQIDQSLLNDNQQFRDAFNELHQAASSASEYEHAGWFERRWKDLKAAPGAIWDWIKDHGRIVAMGVGFVAAIAITVGTGGLGAPAGVAIVAGIVGGGIIGTAAGAGCEVASGQKKNFWDAAVDVAPSAFAGSIAGATMVGFAPAAAGGGQAAALANGGGTAARFAGLLGREGATKLALPWVQNAANPVVANALRGATIWGSAGLAVNTGKVRDGYAENKYAHFGEAAMDFASGEAKFIADGALFGGFKGKQFLALSLGKNALVEGLSPNRPQDFTSFGKAVLLDTGDDYLARSLNGLTSKLPLARQLAPGTMTPFLRNTPIINGQSRMFYAVGYGLATGDGSEITPEMAKQLGLPPKPAQPAPEGPIEKSNPTKPSDAKPVEAPKDNKTGFTDQGTFDYSAYTTDEGKK